MFFFFFFDHMGGSDTKNEQPTEKKESILKDLTSSSVDRQNILNNHLALDFIRNDLELPGVKWNNDFWFTKQQVADIFNVDVRTIERYLESNESELKINGYVVVKGSDLQELKSLFATDIDVGSKVRNLGVFSFRAVLNIAMLLTESEKAKIIRQRILDIVMDVIAQKTGGHTKHINQRDGDYLLSAFQEKTYRKNFTAALNECVAMGSYKYALFTDLIYQSIFHEKANEYRKILRLNGNEKIRETMYSEVLELIASYENGFAEEIKRKYTVLKRKLSQKEVEDLFNIFASHPLFDPLKEKARAKMASRDLCFRDALHQKLEEYISAVPREDFERFLGETSKVLEERIIETQEVFKRLKDR